jgi:hypothetical protein
MSTKEVVKYFGPIVSKNGHGYIYNQDPVLIEKVKKLWMGSFIKTLCSCYMGGFFRHC